MSEFGKFSSGVENSRNAVNVRAAVSNVRSSSVRRHSSTLHFVIVIVEHSREPALIGMFLIENERLARRRTTTRRKRDVARALVS